MKTPLKLKKVYKRDLQSSFGKQGAGPFLEIVVLTGTARINLDINNEFHKKNKTDVDMTILTHHSTKINMLA